MELHHTNSFLGTQPLHQAEACWIIQPFHWVWHTITYSYFNCVWQARESWNFYHCKTSNFVIQMSALCKIHSTILAIYPISTHYMWSGGRLGLLSFRKMPPSSLKCRHANKGVYLYFCRSKSQKYDAHKI
jgi:hypothetical protein